MSDSLKTFFAHLHDSLRLPDGQPGALVKLSLGKYRGNELNLEKVSIRPITIKGQQQLSFTYQYQTRDITKNFALTDGEALIHRYLDPSQPELFKSALLRVAGAEHQLLYNKKNEATLQSRNVVDQDSHATKAHDRSKQRYVDQTRPFLTKLGVTDPAQQIIPAMSRKWKQINKFIEIFQHAFDTLHLPPEQAVHVVDFGAGKGYLTFALHDYLRHARGYQAEVTGVELRDELVQFCERAISDLNIEGLHFYQGDVRSYHPAAVDVMIALHACDIATDYALHTGIRLQADIIMCAPCCHKEVRPQLQMPHVLRPVLQHGVHLGQEAEMLTDGLRALLLEACGYETKVFEFVSLEHTQKNKMILAIRRDTLSQNAARREQLHQQITAIKDFYSIREQRLETLLREDGLLI